MGIAEREQPADNDAFTTMAASRVLDEAIDWAARLGFRGNPRWRAVRDGLRLRHLDRSAVIRSHDGFTTFAKRHPEFKTILVSTLDGIGAVGIAVAS